MAAGQPQRSSESSSNLGAAHPHDDDARRKIKQELLSDLRRQVRPQLGERVLLTFSIRRLPQVRLARLPDIPQPLLEVRRL
jgi:hypothetical protein